MERYRIVEDVGLYYVTFTVVEWLPVFIDETACKIVTDSLNFCTRQKYLRVNAYVIMPTHLHAILFDVEFNSDRLKHTLDDMRKFTGRQLLDYSAQHLPKTFANVFQGHAGKDRQRRYWQPTRHPVGIFSEKIWKQKIDYLHYNPCRKGLVLRPEDTCACMPVQVLALLLRAVLGDARGKRCAVITCRVGIAFWRPAVMAPGVVKDHRRA